MQADDAPNTARAEYGHVTSRGAGITPGETSGAAALTGNASAGTGTDPGVG